MWDEELQIIKDNLNPAITLSDLDGLIIEAGESHVATDGRFAAFYKKMITERRPDNTPAIIENPKWNEAAEALLEKIDDMEGINNFEADFMSGNLQNYDNADYNKMSSELIEQKIKMVMATNKVDSAQAFEIVVEGPDVHHTAAGVVDVTIKAEQEVEHLARDEVLELLEVLRPLNPLLVHFDVRLDLGE